MELVVQIPESLPAAMHRSPEESARDAKMAMAARFFEMKTRFIRHSCKVGRRVTR